MFHDYVRSKGREAAKTEFIQVLGDVEAREVKPLEELIKTDFDRLVPIIGEALLEKFPGLGQ